MWWITIPVVIYSAGLLVLWMILAGRSSDHPPVSGRMPSVSVVVAARNEEKRLPALLASLSRQDYPADLLEVIIVNDNSTDRTPIVVSEYIKSLRDVSRPGMRLVYNPFSGKKSAVRYGIEKAAGEIIITTDADCIAGPGWVRAHASWYSADRTAQGPEDAVPGEVGSSADDRQEPSAGGSHATDMVLASVYQEPVRGFWPRFGDYEFSALQAVTEASATAGYPVMSNAANMSFRREIYIRYSGELHEELPSGDDMFLLEAVMRGGGAARHDGRSTAAVVTAGAVTAAALVRQRARWASKAMHLRSPYTLTLAAATAACNAAVTAAAVTACVTGAYSTVVAAMYAIKAIPDYLLIAGEMKKRGTPIRVMQFIGSELLYPFYFMAVWMMSLFPSSRRFAGR